MSASDLHRDAAGRVTTRSPSHWGAGGAFLMLSLLRAGTAFDEREWIEYVRDWMCLHLHAIEPRDFSAWGAARVALMLNSLIPDQALATMGKAMCALIRVGPWPRTEDGLLLPAENVERVVAESLYFSAPLLALCAESFDDRHYFDEAARQLFGYAGHAQDAVTHLFFRAWNPVERSCDEVLDARGNGFAINALVDTLEYLPFDHHRRRAIQMILTYAAAGLDAHQDVEGFWHEIMDDENSSIDASATALLTAALARGLKLGSVNEDHRDNALRGWSAVQANVDDADAACILLAAAAIHELATD